MDLVNKNIEDKIKNNLLEGLSPDNLEVKISNLTKAYYETFFSNNIGANELILTTLNLIVSEYPEYNLAEFINYCFLSEVHKFLNNSIDSGVILKAFKFDLKKGSPVLKHDNLLLNEDFMEKELEYGIRLLNYENNYKTRIKELEEEIEDLKEGL